MTEPVARAVSPRRTVRVAVALVAGQAALCAVIGWVTFGPSEAKPQAAGAQPLSEPIVLPTPPPIPVDAVPAAPSATAAGASSTRASRSSSRPTTPATSSPAAEKPRPVMAEQTSSESPAPNPELAATPPPLPPGLPAPSPSESVQSPVVVGRPCGPEGAKGRTAESVDLRCVKDAGGDLVWQIN